MKRRLSLAGQLLALQVVIICLVLVGVAAVSVAQSTERAEQTESRRALAIAENFASSVALRSTIQAGQLEAVRAAAEEVRSNSGSASVVVADRKAVVLASADPALLGRRYPLGDSDVLAGRAWVGDVEVGDGRGAVAMAPVLDEEGFLGFVGVIRPYS